MSNKYTRTVRSDTAFVDIDVYDVLVAFEVTCPARQHAIKKLLCAGLRGKGSPMQDLTECAAAVQRAIELQARRKSVAEGIVKLAMAVKGTAGEDRE